MTWMWTLGAFIVGVLLGSLMWDAAHHDVDTDERWHQL